MGYFRKPKLTSTAPHMSRRRFLGMGACATGISLFPRLALAQSLRAGTPEKSLAFYNTHTGETLHRVYWFRGRYLPDALQAFSRILRDHRVDEIRSIDPELLDLLYAIGKEVDADEPFHIFSGYRSAITNAMLRQTNPRVAEDSLHVQGKAVDIKIPGRSVAVVRRAAMALQRGGVGSYPHAQFIHVDTGPVRVW
jgi:uncharacterized protein YcbK (DUF882 family)